MCDILYQNIIFFGFYVEGKTLQEVLRLQKVFSLTQSLKMANEELAPMCGASEEFQKRISDLEECLKAQNS